jgi:hypothetical protein
MKITVVTPAKAGVHVPKKVDSRLRGNDVDGVASSDNHRESWRPQNPAGSRANPAADEWRAEAWNVIKRTPNPLWQVLTKRAECIADRLAKDWGNGYPNVCLGVTVDRNFPQPGIRTSLLTCPLGCSVNFSCSI